MIILRFQGGGKCPPLPRPASAHGPEQIGSNQSFYIKNMNIRDSIGENLQSYAAI